MTKPTIFLAIETASQACSAAVLITPTRVDKAHNTQAQIYSEWELAPRRHTALILPMLDKVLQQAGCQLQDVDYLAYGQGPGAFTGVRIACSVVQALSFAHQLPVIGISSLAALAWQGFRQFDVRHILVSTDARMQEVYSGAYHIEADNRLVPLMNETVIKPELLAEYYQSLVHSTDSFCALGNGWQAYPPGQPQDLESLDFSRADQILYPHARDIAELAYQQQAYPDYSDEAIALPVYLRNQVTHTSEKKV